MNRRNFVVGLGTVATISGVASVTAASFADSVTATSDFRVIVDENLTLELGDDVPEESELESEESWSDETLDDFEDIEFEDEDNGQLIYIDDIEGEPENDDIEIELAIANDPDIEDQDGYDELLAVRNDGISDQEVGIEYVYGTDVDTNDLDSEYAADEDPSDGVVDPDEVATLFEFEFENSGEAISPDPDGEDDEARFDTVEGGETEQINLNIDLEGSGIADTLADEADVEDEIFSSSDGAGDDFQLLDAIRVGVQEEDED